jgi:sphingolipid 8-(E)-desaturase
MDNHVLRIPHSWLSSHPGGGAMILHHVGRDATDEINAYHCDETLSWISKYSIGILDLSPDELWENFVPPLQAGWIRKPAQDGALRWYREALDSNPSVPAGLLVTNDDLSFGSPTLATITPPPSSLDLKEQAALSAAYKELHEHIKQKGLYQTHYIRGYGSDVARFVLLGTLSLWFYRHDWLFLSSFFLGCLWHQVVFTVHDLGHVSVTHNWEWDRLISIFLADFIGGISVSWWTDVSRKPLMISCTY